MTTSEEMEVLEPTVEVDNSPRDLAVLIDLPTYQGMTDEEIDMVIDYRCQQAIFGEAMKSMKSVEMDSRKAVDAILDKLMDNALESQKTLLEQLENRKFRSMQPLAVNAVTLELEPMEVGDSIG